jgi:hypothetical protein
MKTALSTFNLLLFLLLSGFVSGQLTFQKTYLIESAASAYSFKITSDNGFIVAGPTGDTSSEMFIMKLDSVGDTVWTKIFSSFTTNDGYAVVQCYDGGYAVCGTSMDLSPGYTSFILKTDSSGNQAWIKSFKRTGQANYVNDLIQTSDSGFALSGFLEQSMQLVGGGLFIKTDSMGNVMSAAKYADSHCQFFNSMQTIDGGYIFSGIKLQTNGLWITRRYPGGSSWSKIYRPVAFNASLFGTDSHVSPTSDGGYMIACTHTTYDTLQFDDLCLIKIDSAGNIKWSYRYDTGFHEYGLYVEETSDHGFIASGSIYDVQDLIAIKTDSVGNVIFSKRLGTPASDYSLHADVHQTADGGFVIASEDGLEAYLIKTDASGNSGCNDTDLIITMDTVLIQVIYEPPLDTMIVINDANESLAQTSNCQVTTLCLNNSINSPDKIISNPVIIFPNPVSNQFAIDNSGLKFSAIEIYNSLGEKVYSATIHCASCIVHCESFSRGIYFAKINSGEKIFFEKFIKQ